MSNYLFITNNDEAVEALTKQYAEENNLEFFSYQNNREDMDAIHELFIQNDNLCIFIQGLNKSSVSDTLLKLLEENSKNIHVFATAKDDIKDALKARFTVRFMRDKSYINEINDFLADKKVSKDVYSDVCFYKQLANYFANNYDDNTLYNLKILHSIIEDCNLATNTLNYDYQFDRLRNLRWC